MRSSGSLLMNSSGPKGRKVLFPWPALAKPSKTRCWTRYRRPKNSSLRYSDPSRKAFGKTSITSWVLLWRSVLFHSLVLDWIDLQENPYPSGMGPLPEIRSEDSNAQGKPHFDPSLLRSPLNVTTPHPQRAPAPGSENIRMS